jgi:cell wall-associated NlpC family hydrolase
MTNRLLDRSRPATVSQYQQVVTTREQRAPRLLIVGIVGLIGVVGLGLLAVPMLIGTDMFYAARAGCTGQQTGTAGQPIAGPKAKSIPPNYLYWYKRVAQQYGVPWTILAGIGTVESDNGRTTLPGVHTGQNGFGAAGPMQIGIGGAAGNVWGGPPVHPASEVVDGVAADEDGDGIASVYDPADAIAGAAKYLVAADVRTNPSSAIFAYNHLQSYVQSVLFYAGQYAGGNYSVVAATMPSANSAAGCATTTGNLSTVKAPTQAVATAIAYAEQQIGKPYQWGATGPDAFDCSGLVMMAYRAAGINIARTSEEQWATEPHVAASQVQPGDLVFFAGADGTPASPGHVGLVIGHGQMIEAYATGFPIRISTYGTVTSAAGDEPPVGFTRPGLADSKRSTVVMGMRAAGTVTTARETGGVDAMLRQVRDCVEVPSHASTGARGRSRVPGGAMAAGAICTRSLCVGDGGRRLLTGMRSGCSWAGVAEGAGRGELDPENALALN